MMQIFTSMSIEGFEAHSHFRQAISCRIMAKPAECYQSLLSLRRPDVDNQQTVETVYRHC